MLDTSDIIKMHNLGLLETLWIIDISCNMPSIKHHHIFYNSSHNFDTWIEVQMRNW